ncbi:hypothetical protein [Sphingobium fluviale]|uniref:Uncharacterized protein n=1 Tax=Sphingobium fluviale TaxID=2506423 RepID=A0A4Q1KHK5_9SPHN|nr:hypothetical protein [Sphingobium fluviale]RXR28835.1 hypothetical protein EQG66_08970 [Sphingobium fluviale]
MKRRNAHLVLVSLAAIGGAGAGALLPVDMLELASSTIGLDRFIPAAAPPLGASARLIIIACAGLGAGGLAALLSPLKTPVAPKDTEDTEMTFIASTFSALFRRGAKRVEQIDDMPAAEPEIELAPSVRRADAHPDAPPRAPLIVSRDLAGEASPLVDEEPRGPIVEDITGLSMPRAPEPLPWEAIETEMSRLLENVRFRSVEDTPDASEQSADSSAVEPTIRDLTERLERGIARRRGEYAAIPAAAILPQPEDQVPEEAALPAALPAAPSPDLDAALAVLRGLTAKAG